MRHNQVLTSPTRPDGGIAVAASPKAPIPRCMHVNAETSRRRHHALEQAAPAASPGPTPGPMHPQKRSAQRRRFRSRRAFSLVEMMVVLVLIGLLAGLVTINVRQYMVSGRQNAAKAEIRTIVDAINTYYTQHGRYPSSEEGLEALIRTGPHQAEPLLSDEPVDPWGNRYQYFRPGRSGEPFEVVSFGADGREGGEGADAEISSSRQRDRR